MNSNQIFHPAESTPFVGQIAPADPFMPRLPGAFEAGLYFLFPPLLAKSQSDVATRELGLDPPTNQ